MNILQFLNKRTFLSMLSAIVAYVAIVSILAPQAHAITTPSLALAGPASNEIDRRLGVLNQDQTALKTVSVLQADTWTKLSSGIASYQHDLNDAKSKLALSKDANEVFAIANAVDASFNAYQSIHAAATLSLDLQAQSELRHNLTNLAGQVQQSIDTAKANGATHATAGNSGFVPVEEIQNKLNQIKSTIAASKAPYDSALSVLSTGVSGGLTSSSTLFASASADLSISYASLHNAGLGLSQLIFLTTGGRSGLNYCGIASNCDGSKNNGVLQICGTDSTCKNSTNNGWIQICGYKSNCSGSTNNGAVQICGGKSDCSNSTNNGVLQICGVKSTCTNSTNNGAVQVCGYKSDCSNSTNNGLFQFCGVNSDCSGSTNNGGISICGSNSNCSGSTNNGFLSICGDHSDCSGSENHAQIFICGSYSNCSTTIIQGCEYDANGEPINR